MQDLVGEVLRGVGARVACECPRGSWLFRSARRLARPDEHGLLSTRHVLDIDQLGEHLLELVAGEGPAVEIPNLGLDAAGQTRVLAAGVLDELGSVFRGRDRAVAFAVWGSIIGGVSALGPLIGGFLIEGYGWEWAFLINVPIAALTITMALKWV